MEREEGFGLVVVLVIVVVVGLVGGGVYVWHKGRILPVGQLLATPTPTQPLNVSASSMPTVQPTRDPYAGWKTYTGTKYGYLLKYPGDWHGVFPANYDGKNDGTRYEFASPDYVEGATIVQTLVAKGARVDITVAPTNNIIDDFKQSAAGIEGLHNLQLNGQPAVRWDTEGYEGVYHTVTVAIKDGNEYDIVLVYPQGDKSRYLSVYQQILESLTLP